MFRQLAVELGGSLPDAANVVMTQFAPTQLAQFVELTWSAPRSIPRGYGAVAGDYNMPDVYDPPTTVSASVYSRSMGRAPAQQYVAANPPSPASPGLPAAWDPWANAPTRTWDHAVYAFVIESTGIFEIMRRVLGEWLLQERLPFPTLESQHWMRATEELFFTSPSPYFHSLTSLVRPDAAAIRANLYQRLLGLDLPFRTGSDAAAHPRPNTVNADWVPDFERLLYEAWRGFVNRLNANNENLTDAQAVRELVRNLREMLNARRINASLLREEFSAVTTASWFHLAVEHNNVVVNNLDAQSQNQAERLGKIAALVGMRPSRVSDAYFRLADPLSALMTIVENGSLEAAGVETLYSGELAPLSRVMQQIVTNWERATGRSIKDGSAVRSIRSPVTASIGAPTSVLQRLAGASV